MASSVLQEAAAQAWVRQKHALLPWMVHAPTNLVSAKAAACSQMLAAQLRDCTMSCAGAMSYASAMARTAAQAA